MATPAASLAQATVPSRAELLVAGSLGLLATVIAAVLPVLVGAWQSELGMGAHEAGYVAATELFAQVVGTVIFLRAERYASWRRCAALGLGLMIVGNLACAGSIHLAALLGSRVIAGTGGGLVRALAMNCLARAQNPGRAFAIYASGQVAIAASVSAAIPAFLGAVGLRVPFAALAAVCAAGMALIGGLPARPLPEARAASRFGLPAPAVWALVGLFVFFVGQAAVWTYLAPLGAQQGLSAAAIATTLTYLNVAGLVGTLGAGALADRVPPVATIGGLLGITLVSVLALFHAHAPVFFALSACVFYFAWCASLPFQFAIIARCDEAGAAGAAAPAIDGLGLASGAALGGVLIVRLGLGSIGTLCAMASAAGIASYAVAASSRRRRAPLGMLGADVRR